jgi:hypothetical protein
VNATKTDRRLSAFKAEKPAITANAGGSVNPRGKALLNTGTGKTVDNPPWKCCRQAKMRSQP